MRHTSQKTTALSIVLTMILILSACAAEDDTEQEYTGGDPKSADDKLLPRPAGPGDSYAGDEARDALIGSDLANKRFMSIEKKEIGLGPDGPEIGHWSIYFSSSTFQWDYSDVAESGTYVLEGKEVIGQTSDRKIFAEYDPASGVLTWDGTDYRSVEAAK